MKSSYSYLFYFMSLMFLHLVVPVLSAERCLHPYYDYYQGYCSGSTYCCSSYAYTFKYYRSCCYSYSYYYSYSSVGTVVGASVGSLMGLLFTGFVVLMVCKHCGEKKTRGNVVNVNPATNPHVLTTVQVPVQPGQSGQFNGAQAYFGHQPGYQAGYPPNYGAPPSTSHPNYVEQIETIHLKK